MTRSAILCSAVLRTANRRFKSAPVIPAKPGTRATGGDSRVGRLIPAAMPGLEE